MGEWNGVERRGGHGKRKMGFRGLRVWEESHLLAKMVYRYTASFPREELYGLTSQMRRSAVSIPTNIAEGFGRGGRVELKRFLGISKGSAYEIEYLILLSRDLGYLKSRRGGTYPVVFRQSRACSTNLSKNYPPPELPTRYWFYLLPVTCYLLHF